MVSGHMAANLAVNVHNALEGFPLATNIQRRLDSTVAFHWLGDNGEYRQFVANRVRKIQSHTNLLCAMYLHLKTLLASGAAEEV